MPHLATFLLHRRTALGLGREATAQLAHRAAPRVLGIYRSSIERWERGEASPDPGQLEALCRALGVSDNDRLDLLRQAAEEPRRARAA